MYLLGWNNAEYPEEVFDTYAEAYDRGVDVGGQWCITEEVKLCDICDKVELTTEEELETGICADCMDNEDKRIYEERTYSDEEAD